MAIIGATTMDLEFFNKHGLGSSIWNNGALGTQIQWFQQLMPSICGAGDDRFTLVVCAIANQDQARDYQWIR